MPEKVFLIHGWSVAETTTYQSLHLKLEEAGYDLKEIYLGRYVSMDDHVEIKDISKALDRALREALGRPPWKGPFHIITHSTGALVAKRWITHHYVGKAAEGKPLKNLVFLAGPHFGSRLAHHGRSMLAHAAYLGDTGTKVLEALELGSAFSWENNEKWLDPAVWKRKGIRPFSLIGDRVEKSIFKSRVMPAAYEPGSDMVVRVPAGNLNFRRFRLNGSTGKIQSLGGIRGVPFAALADYVHSGEKNGIMNNITRRAQPKQAKYLNLRLILECLGVKNAAGYERMRVRLERVNATTRKKRSTFAQLDFRFRDDSGAPIDDYSVTLGAIVGGEERASKTVANIHKNLIDPSHFTVFLDLKEFEPKYPYFVLFNVSTGTDLYGYQPDPLRIVMSPAQLAEIIAPDQTTQLEVVLERDSSRDLFVFHRGDDPDLHLKWDREGKVTKRRMPIR